MSYEEELEIKDYIIDLNEPLINDGKDKEKLHRNESIVSVDIDNRD